MGSIERKALIPTDNPPEASVVLGGSSPVGSEPRYRPTSAVRLLMIGDQIGYGADVPIHAIERRREATLRTGKTVRWLRFEYKVARADGIAAGDSLVVAEYPWSSSWVQVAPWRPVSKKSKHERIKDEPEHMDTDDPAEVIRRLEALSYDPWASDGDYLTAGISIPEPSLTSEPSREWKVELRQVFGSYPKTWKSPVATIFKSRYVRELLALTRSGKIIFWPKGVVAAPLTSEVIDDANSLMFLAISQALAGVPDSSDEAEPTADESIPRSRLLCNDWVDHPVVELASRIYRNHLYNANRRALDRSNKLERSENA